MGIFMKRTLIALPGCSTSEVEGDFQLVICADSGYSDTISSCYSPDYLVGDLDSLAPDLIEHASERGVEILRHDPDKNLTDGEIALELALERGADKILICGGKSGRSDHILSSFFLLYRIPKGTDAELVLDGDVIRLLRRGDSLSIGKIHQVISLLPVGGDCRVSISGVKWALDGEILRLGGTRGIHNEPVGEEVDLKVWEGDLFLILSRKG